MDATAHIRRLAAATAAATAAFLVLAGPASAYGWPVKPFHRQHPVRSVLGDPRIVVDDLAHSQLHFGIDVFAPNGTPVYATLDGTASIHPLHADTVLVAGGGGLVHEYWHVVPSIRSGQPVRAYRTVIGRVERPWAHVHFSEMLNGVYLNPLRPGALAPFADHTRPRVRCASFERDGRAVRGPLSQLVDLVADVRDETPLPVPAPWNDKPVMPGLVRWRIGDDAAGGGWHVAVDLRDRLPSTSFLHVYAPWSQQNRAGASGTGRYRILLAEDWDSRSVRDGVHRLVIEVADTRGNTSRASFPLRVANRV